MLCQLHVKTADLRGEEALLLSTLLIKKVINGSLVKSSTAVKIDHK